MKISSLFLPLYIAIFVLVLSEQGRGSEIQRLSRCKRTIESLLTTFHRMMRGLFGKGERRRKPLYRQHKGIKSSYEVPLAAPLHHPFSSTASSVKRKPSFPYNSNSVFTILPSPNLASPSPKEPRELLYNPFLINSHSSSSFSISPSTTTTTTSPPTVYISTPKDPTTATTTTDTSIYQSNETQFFEPIIENSLSYSENDVQSIYAPIFYEQSKTIGHSLNDSHTLTSSFSEFDNSISSRDLELALVNDSRYEKVREPQVEFLNQNTFSLKDSMFQIDDANNEIDNANNEIDNANTEMNEDEEYSHFRGNSTLTNDFTESTNELNKSSTAPFEQPLILYPFIEVKTNADLQVFKDEKSEMTIDVKKENLKAEELSFDQNTNIPLTTLDVTTKSIDDIDNDTDVYDFDRSKTLRFSPNSTLSSDFLNKESHKYFETEAKILHRRPIQLSTSVFQSENTDGVSEDKNTIEFKEKASNVMRANNLESSNVLSKSVKDKVFPYEQTTPISSLILNSKSAPTQEDTFSNYYKTTNSYEFTTEALPLFNNLMDFLSLTSSTSSLLSSSFTTATSPTPIVTTNTTTSTTSKSSFPSSLSSSFLEIDLVNSKMVDLSNGLSEEKNDVFEYKGILSTLASLSLSSHHDDDDHEDDENPENDDDRDENSDEVHTNASKEEEQEDTDEFSIQSLNHEKTPSHFFSVPLEISELKGNGELDPTVILAGTDQDESSFPRKKKNIRYYKLHDWSQKVGDERKRIWKPFIPLENA